jgi:lipid A 3-O-deacylase
VFARRLNLRLAACALCMLPHAARADDKDRITLLEENDSLYFNSDKHYTQGLRISDLRPDLAPDSLWQRPFA